MPSDADTRRVPGLISRRTLVKTLVAVAGVASVAPRVVMAQASNPEPRSVPRLEGWVSG